MNIKQLIKDAHNNAIEKGFYDLCDCNEGYGYTCSLCNNETGVIPNKNIGELLMLIVSELSEALEAHRKGSFSRQSALVNISDYPEDDHRKEALYLFETYIKDTFEDEFADIKLRIYDLCGYLNITPNKVRGMVNWRSNNVADKIRQISKKVLVLNPDYIDNDFKTVLGFAILYIDKFCEDYKIDQEKHIIAKMSYNETRPQKHGKNY